MDTGASFTGGDGNDVFNATGATLTASDSLNGGAGTDKLVVTDTTSASAAGLPANLALTSIETLEVSSNTTLGKAGSTGTAQVTTYTIPAVTANVQQSNQYVFSAAPTDTGTATFTYGGAAGSFTMLDSGDSGSAATAATAFANSVNAIAGKTVAYTGQVIADGELAASTATTSKSVVYTNATSGLQVGMSVSGTGIAAGTYIAAISADKKTITLSAFPSATLTTSSGDLTYGGGTGGVTVLAPTAGSVLPPTEN